MNKLPLTISLFASLVSLSFGQTKLEFFEKRIRPVLVDQCVSCHGPDIQESDLRVDHISFLTVEGNYGKPIVPGSPDKSVLLQAIRHTHSELKMPEDRPRMSGTILADFERWIKDGAAWPRETVPAQKAKPSFNLTARKRRLNWIWTPPQSYELPIVENTSWPATDADSFILAALEARDLRPASRASSEGWLRRAHFALTGLPPSLSEINSFLADDSPQSREQVVDGLLASPHFGERWARHWMDLVRYAESRGHEDDFLIANAWRYRDYLIEAFNSDVPYDQFVVEHLAGDLLPAPRLEPTTGANQSILGTGWAFLGEEVHSPVKIRQDECDRIDNKIDVLSKTFLGLTVACARCHDHKFDALSQDDYYAMAGFLLSSNYRQVRFQSMEHNRKIAEHLATLKKETRRELVSLIGRELLRQIGGLKMGPGNPEHSQLEALLSAETEAQQAALLTKWEAQLTAWTAEEKRRQTDAYRVLADFSDPNEMWMQDGYAFGSRARHPGELIIGKAGEPIRLAEHFAAASDDFWDSLSLDKSNDADASNLHPQKRSGRMLRTRKVDFTSGRLFYLLEGSTNAYAGVDSHLMLKGPLHQHLAREVTGKNDWQEHNVAVSEGARVYVQLGAVPGKPLAVRKIIQSDKVPKVIERPNAFLLNMLRNDAGFSESLESRIRSLLGEIVLLFARDQWPVQPATSDMAKLVNQMLQPESRFPISDDIQEQIKQVVATYHEKREELKKQLHAQSATAVALMDGNGINENRLHRGSSNQPREIVIRSLPTAFGFDEIEVAGSGRLQLAHQIASDQNPLTARVLVNRLWHHLFGRGIVATVDNFGWLGDRPTHPELLDHLAWQFMHKQDWSIKKMLRELVLSETFAQSSEATNKAFEASDPQNRWLHRMRVRRLEAEAIRDSALAISGRLDRQIYGKPVPVHLTEFVVGRGRPGESGPLDGKGRRTVYSSLRRNFLPTLWTTFDFPTPFSTVGRRNVTNVPAQSLALMNDPLIYQQAEVWAARILDELDNKSNEIRVRKMYLEAFCRIPSEAETTAAIDSLREFASLYDCSPDDQRVWRDLCHAMFSMNEFIYLR